MFAWWRRRRRRKLQAASLTPEQEEFLSAAVDPYRKLAPVERRELRGHVAVLLAEKHFEGCGGLELTDEMRVAIAGWAAMLLLHRDTDYFPSIRTILVYPEEFVAPVVEETDYGVVHEGEEVRAGETGAEGTVVLSWSDVERAIAHRGHGQNVVLHEFAHVLDHENADSDGVPVLEDHADYEQWVEVIGSELARLRRDSEAGRATVLDDYGALDEAEFFAVATEYFFTRPRRMRRNHPRLYSALSDYYRQDPVRYQPLKTRL